MSDDTRQQRADDLTLLVMRGVKTNLALNAVARTALGIVATVAVASALYYVLDHAAEIVTAISAPGPDAQPLGTRLLGQALPIGILVLLAFITGSATWLLHSRGQEDLERATDGIGRLRREAEVAIPARGLTHVFEEKLANARRAYSLQLWLGRTLFIVSLGLFTAGVINALLDGDALVSLALTAGSLLGALYGTARHVPRTIGHQLADVVQLQSAITGCDRQLGMFETYSYAMLSGRQDADPREVLALMSEVHQNIEEVLDRAIKRIERYADAVDEAPDVVDAAAAAAREGRPRRFGRGRGAPTGTH